MVLELPDNASFSGSDIKAVVHLPINTKAIENEIAELQQQLSDLDQELSEALSLSTSPEERASQVARNQGRVDAARATSQRIQQLQELSRSGSSTMAVTLAELSTISYSIHRETFPVRSLGSVYVRDYTRGPRTIAGSLVFTVFNRHVLTSLLESTNAIVSTGVAGNIPDQYKDISPVLPDQIPPFDVTVNYNNEYGESAVLIIYGVQIVNEGQVTSVNDMITENQMEYVARDIDIMRDVGTRNLVRNLGIGKAKTPRDLAASDDSFQRLLRRRNPFI